MKKIFACIAIMGLTICAAAQDPTPADKGVTYGDGTTAQGAVPVTQIEANMKEEKFTGKATGKVLSVCQEKGCWMKIEKANGEAMMVKFKDYGFFMPKNIVGKEVVVDGEATVKETSVKQLKHYAGDAGKSKEEISKIKSPKKELIFTAKGVLVL
jgi:Domain of unknown function (DUF4920)